MSNNNSQVSPDGHIIPTSERRRHERPAPSLDDLLAQRDGFRFAAGHGRPYAHLFDGQTTLKARVAAIGSTTIELVAETVGLEAWHGRRCALSIADADVRDLVGRLYVDDSEIVFVVEMPTVESSAALFSLAMQTPSASPKFSLPPSAERIDDAQGIRAILRGLIVNNAQSRIRADGSDWLLQPIAMHEGSIEWQVLARGGTRCSPLAIEAAGYSASYELPVLVVEESPTVLYTTIPRTVERVRRRRMPRVSTRGELLARFTHPVFGFLVERPVVDVSDDGLGLQIDASELLCPGLLLQDVAIVRYGKLLASVNAEVKQVRAQTAGLALEGDVTLRRTWNRLVRELLHERTRSWDYNADELWDLYEGAGYFNLSGKTPEDFAELKTAFTDATARLARAPEVGYHVLWPSERGVDAAVTNVLVYSRAHLGYQMAKRPGKTVGGTMGKEMLRDIHWHTLEEALASSQSDWWIGYVQASTRFSNLLFVEFQARFRDAARECVVPFRPYQVDCSDVTPHLDADAFATREEIETLCATIRATRPLPYWKSQDLTPEHMDLADLKPSWERVGLQRERAVLVIREGGELKAALVADLGHPGLHVYGLLDITRFYPISDDGERYRDRLLEMAKRWYVSHGRTEFKHFHEDARPLPDAEDRIDMGPASICIISMELIPDLLDYLFEHMSWDPQLSLPPAPNHASLPPSPASAPRRNSSSPSKGLHSKTSEAASA